ncbi:MAG: M23 family metallopeptidase [Gemmatimonadaceae bacterium]
MTTDKDLKRFIVAGRTRPVFVATLALLAGCARASTSVDTEPAPVIAAPPASPTPVRTPLSSPVSSADIQYFQKHLLMVPVEGVSPRDLRDSFNESRGGGRTHRATDILVPRGTPVVAATDGELIQRKENTAGGLTVYLIDDAHRFVYYYAHMDRYSEKLLETVRVRQGFILGYVGTTGNAPADTPHLHFQAMRYDPAARDWWNGPAVDVRLFFTLKGKASP